MKYFLLFCTVFIAKASFADHLKVDFSSNNYSIIGIFTFVPGSSVKIMSHESIGRACQLLIESKPQNGGIIKFEYKFECGDEVKESGAIITKFGEKAKITSGIEGQKPLQLEVEWNK